MSNKPDPKKYKNIRVPDEDIKIEKDESFKEKLKEIIKK